NVEATTLTVNFWCQGVGSTNISAAEGGVTSAVVVINCVAPTALTATPNATTHGTPSTIAGGCTAVGQILGASAGGVFNSSGIVNGSWTDASDVTCLAVGAISAQFDCNATATVTFTLGATSTTLACTGTGGGSVTGLTVTPPSNTIGAVSTVSGTCTA